MYRKEVDIGMLEGWSEALTVRIGWGRTDNGVRKERGHLVFVELTLLPSVCLV